MTISDPSEPNPVAEPARSGEVHRASLREGGHRNGDPPPVATVVVLNWNGRQLLPECLDALAGQDLDRPWEAWVVDNGSTDGSLELLAEKYPDVHVVRNGANYGFAGGNNKALAQVATPYVVLLNNDAHPEPDWLRRLVTAIEADPTGEVGAVSSKVLFQPRFMELSFETPVYTTAADPRELGARVSRVELDGVDITDEVLWDNGAYGAEGHAGPGGDRFRWTSPSGTLMLPVLSGPRAPGPVAGSGGPDGAGGEDDPGGERGGADGPSDVDGSSGAGAAGPGGLGDGGDAGSGVGVGPWRLTVTARAEKAKPFTVRWGRGAGTSPDPTSDRPPSVRSPTGDDEGGATVELTDDYETHEVTVPADVPTVDVLNNVGSIMLTGGYGADRGYQEIDAGQYDEGEDVFLMCGCAVIMRRDALDRVGLFDDDFFLYYEDTDLSWRLQAAGWRIRYQPEPVVRHLHSASSGEWSPLFTFHVERNRLLMLLKNAPAGLAVRQFLRFTVTTASMFRWALLQAVRDRRRPAVRPLLLRLKVMASYTRLLPKMLVKRRAINRIRRVPARDILGRWLRTSR